MSRPLFFLIAAGIFGLVASTIPCEAEAQVTHCEPYPVGPAGYRCYTTRPAAPAEDPADRMIRNMAPECLSASGALSEMLLAYAQPVPGGNAAAKSRNMMLVEQARKQRCAEAQEAARREALFQETLQAEARLRAEQTRLYEEQEAARQRAAQEKAARDQWLGMVSQAVLEGRCSDAKEMALRQGRLDVADQVQRVCIPPAPIKTQPRSVSPAPIAKVPSAVNPHPSASATRVQQGPSPTRPPPVSQASGQSAARQVAGAPAQTPLEMAIAKASKGDPAAQSSLGAMYANGRGVPRDDAAAVYWYRAAAAQGFAKAQSSLGVMYATGKGVPQDDAAAVVWYRKAADQGWAQGQSNLGYMYANGRGVPRDDAAAVFWYRAAAAQGLAKAQSNLGFMYETGRGVPQDDAAAAAYYMKAAEQGLAAAQVGIARLYRLGKGVPLDPLQAEIWETKAKAQRLAQLEQ